MTYGTAQAFDSKKKVVFIVRALDSGYICGKKFRI